MKFGFIIVFFLLIVNFTKAQKLGCTDPLALNYDASAIQNDGSCAYSPALITPSLSESLPEIMLETSGLIFWNGKLWTHNDNQDINIYSFHIDDVNSFQKHEITGSINIDWEEISQDANYLYIGDFGNNVNGNRTDLKILKVDKNSVLENSPIIETISFNYSTQSDFNPTGSNNTDFDCEAFIVSDDSIYLFTKEWKNNKTSVYSLPNSPGSYTASFKSAFDVQGLITGAVFLESKYLIALSGYNNLLQPFIYLIYDFNGKDFFSGNKRKINIDLSLHQVEGITTEDGLIYYLTNERFVFSPLVISQRIHVLDLTVFLNDYLSKILGNKSVKNNYLHIYPVPSVNFIFVEKEEDLTPENYFILDMQGKIVTQGQLRAKKSIINISQLPIGEYLFMIGDKNIITKKIVKI